MVFVDTSAWFALFVPTDPDHLRLRDWFAQNREPLVTSDYCIDETLTLLLVRCERLRAMEAGRQLFEHNLTRIQFVSPEQIQRAWIVFQQRAAAGWSFTDCTTFVVINELASPQRLRSMPIFSNSGRLSSRSARDARGLGVKLGALGGALFLTSRSPARERFGRPRG